jgi:hypothetical protein
VIFWPADASLWPFGQEAARRGKRLARYLSRTVPLPERSARLQQHRAAPP